MEITFNLEIRPSVDQIIELYENSGLPRPINDKERIEKMYRNSNLVVSAWDNQLLIGISRSITDWVWSCYLADLAIRQEYQNKGVGRKLVELTKEKVGEQSMVLLLSVPSAMEYYPRIGLEKVDNAFILNRRS